uniref:Uncharacterized protein n=1 Tax=Candidatus Kentrum sp. LFY TaxID=2126342 RepID=A0A450WE52_9GAMM|nr:MAG: hypothetical protein BECKLFY1418C_GA0070996_101429 [Candidatus Kentron sp. LFY]
MDVIPAGGAAFQAALFGSGNQKTVGYRCSQRESIRAHGGLVEGWAKALETSAEGAVPIMNALSLSHDGHGPW